MMFPVETECSNLEETRARTDNDLIHELSRRIDSLSRYDQYIANAKDRDAVKHFWCNIKSQEQQNVQLLKELLTEEMRYVQISPQCLGGLHACQIHQIPRAIADSQIRVIWSIV